MDRLRKVTLKGGYFEQETCLDLFGRKQSNVRGSLVFGRNGSGKSSITKLLSKYNNGKLTENDSVLFGDGNNDSIMDAISPEKLYIYDEEFIDTNVRFESNSGLETIVMLGEQIETQKDIDRIENEISVLKRERDMINLEEYKDKANPISPEFYSEKIKKELKGENGWARIDSDIKRNSNKSAINDKVLERIENAKSTSSLDDLQHAFNEKFLYYKNITNINDKLNKFDIMIRSDVLESDYKEILNEIVNRPIGDDWVDKLNKSSIQYGTNHVLKMAEHFQKKVDYCPFCLRDISNEEIQNVLNAIRIQQNIEVETYRLRLEELKLTTLELEDLNYYKEVFSNEVSVIQSLMMKYNKVVEKLNDYVNERLSDIFRVVKFNKLNFDNIVSDLNDSIDDLNTKISKFNLDVDNSNEIMNELIEMNNSIHYKLLRDNYVQRKKQKTEFEDKSKEFHDLESRILDKNNQMELLIDKQKSVDVAVDVLNKFLAQIFLSKSRLRVELKDGEYIVKSRGNTVHKKNLSTGERNAISLCYFFSLMNVGLPIGSLFEKEMLIVMDDPISSFDIENRVGIFSFIRNALGDVVSKNEKSKVIIFTHKIDVYLDLMKLFDDIFRQYKAQYREFDKMFQTFQLSDKCLKKIGGKNIYRLLVRDVYKFLLNDSKSDSDFLSIGNKMRRILESFSSFNYGKSSYELTRSKILNNKILDVNLRKHFSSLMQRLLLNNESHMEESIYSIETESFYQYVSDEEKVKTAKSVLVLLFLFDMDHITNMIVNTGDNDVIFRSEDDVIGNLTEWKNEIVDMYKN